jgi:hypothetical protein
MDTGALSPAVKRTEREADHSPPSSAEVKECVDLYLYTPIRLHGMVLSAFTFFSMYQVILQLTVSQSVRHGVEPIVRRMVIFL